MKKIAGLVLISIVTFGFGCGKTNVFSYNFASVGFVNASPGSPTMQIFVDTFQRSPAAIAYRGTSGYLVADPGTRRIQVRSSADLKTNFVDLASESFTSNTASTYFIYDAQALPSVALKAVRLTDVLTVPAARTTKFRFLNLAVTQAPMDVTFLRTSVTPNDSVTVSNQAYIGATPNVSALSPFSGTLPAGNYTIKLKTAGTQTVLTSATIAATSMNSNFSSIFTFFATGTAGGQPLSIGSVRHY